MAFEGMDPDLIEQLGNQLKTQGNQIMSVISAVDGLINQMEGSWKGQDATQFQGWWIQQHRPALNSAAQAVDGLGQSALNNASQQRSTSAN